MAKLPQESQLNSRNISSTKNLVISQNQMIFQSDPTKPLFQSQLRILENGHQFTDFRLHTLHPKTVFLQVGHHHLLHCIWFLHWQPRQSKIFHDKNRVSSKCAQLRQRVAALSTTLEVQSQYWSVYQCQKGPRPESGTLHWEVLYDLT